MYRILLQDKKGKWALSTTSVFFSFRDAKKYQQTIKKGFVVKCPTNYAKLQEWETKKNQKLGVN